MTRTDTAWQNAELAQTFLEGVRGGIPLASEQINLMLKIISLALPKVETFLDLGCGDGVLGRAILAKYPHAKGVFLDFSETMLAAAKSKLGNSQNAEFISQDFGIKDWVNVVKRQEGFDLIVSGFAIHHQTDERKKEIYQEIFDLLKPGGLFLNLEHIQSPSQWVETVFCEVFIDSLYEFHQRNRSGKTREEIAQEYYHRPDKVANILAPLEVQCQWLREIGFINVDCYFKVLEIALFGGMKASI
ncbi:class I SAM-dependent methyltransferase [Phormidium sp. LEGE 05292]|uniref:class I SAM-dependent methyltransferase n=1 Tax=[Phormidium] sp. LEGE 05292 TaxID=767427 RepID=UPI00187EBDE2|nr:class I SAM-dependent methyltransferase [Phormidium sp. LEGE 05292]MBE9228828.1 class I SAM-dependent methyltransferase [Phormidium sp. LEGE 05292]